MPRSLPVQYIAIVWLFLILPSTGLAQSDQWYVGVGAGVSRLTPNPEIAAIDREDEEGSSSILIIGRDFNTRSSGQLQLSSLGQIDFNTGDDVSYNSAEASLLFRFMDTRDNSRREQVFGTALFGRVGLGYLDRDTPVSLSNETAIYFGLGAGLETYFTRRLGIRLEGQYFDTDAGAANVSIIGRFGGTRRSAPRRPPPISRPTQAPSTREPAPTAQPPIAQAPRSAAPVAQTPTRPIAGAPTRSATAPPSQPVFDRPPAQVTTLSSPTTQSGPVYRPQPNVAPQDLATSTLPQVELLAETMDETEPQSAFQRSLPERSAAASPTQASPSIRPSFVTGLPPTRALDQDSDQIGDQQDRCPDTPRNLTVDNNGCELFRGELRGLRYQADRVTLNPSSTESLERLAANLRVNPQARVELIAHTDRSGSQTEQQRRTRGRLRSVGLYLVRLGVSENQLILRSFAAMRPRASNATPEGRRSNNRIEIVEQPR